jgi:signal transduction histidine kinase
LSRRSIAVRVTWGTAAVAASCALMLAAAAGLTASRLWRNQEQQFLRRTADGLAAGIAHEAEEAGGPLATGAAEALHETTLPADHVEVWNGVRLLASSGGGPTLGADHDAQPLDSDEWVVYRRPLPEGLTLVVAARAEHGRRALRVFGFSLALASPVCLVVALVVGRAVALRATRPLLDLQARIRALRALEPLPPASYGDVPVEIADLEDAFRVLWARLEGTVRREREFAANASHELRMPLARIRLLAERARGQPGAEARAALDAQVEEVDRLVRLIESLLILARDASAGIPRGEAVNVADVARRVTERILPAERSECAFPDEAVVRGDEELIEIAVQNLLDNARKFAVGPEAVRAVLTDGGGRVLLEVTTPGARIPSAECERLFDRFYRAPEARAQREGHGLGLTLARHVARLHGGDVRCVSSESEDVRFALELPGWSSADTGSSTSESPGVALSRATTHVEDGPARGAARRLGSR